MNIIINRKKKRNVLVSLYENELSEYDKLFLELIDGYEIKDSKKYTDDIFYMKENNVLIDYDKKTTYAYINYSLIWSVFESKFSLNYQEVIELMRGMLETHLKLKGTTPLIGIKMRIDRLETHLKLKGTTQ